MGLSADERKEQLMEYPHVFDVVLKNGTIVDGTGRQRYKSDVGIRDGKIKSIETSIPRESAARIIDAANKIVCPGFIDAHCHTDWNVLDIPWDDHQERQGVTTQIGGLCGTAPLSPKAHLEEAETRGLGTNYALFAGHGSIREEVMGNEDRPPSQKELDQMKSLLQKAMGEGALGLSTGLIYEPGVFSLTDEIIELAKIIAPMGGIYATHMRSESDEIEEALEEAITIARTAHAPLQISHIKVILPRNWGKSEAILERIRSEQNRGLRITADQYPYTVTGGGYYGAARLAQGFGHDFDFAQFENEYKDESKRKTMAQYAYSLIMERGGPQYFSIIKASRKDLLGLFLPEALSQLTCNEKGHKVKPENPDAESTFPSYTFGDLVVDELYKSKGDFALAYHAVSDEELIHFLEQSWTMAGTDGIQGAFHPRTHGTFPRILGRYVREMKALSLEDAIRKITSLPADTFGFKGRGRILPNAIADIVVFDPDTVIDKSTLVSPNLYPEGIDYVLVNGELVVEKGERTEAFPGKAILRS